MGWHEVISDFLKGCEGALEENTVKYYKYQLRPLVRWAEGCDVPIQEFGRKHMREYLADRAKTVNKTSRRHDVIAAKQLFAFAHHEGYISEDPLRAYETPKRQKPLPNMPTADDLAALLSAVDRKWNVADFPMLKHMGPKVREFYRLRDRAIILTLLQTGARPCELLSLKSTAYRPGHADGPSLVITRDEAKDDETRVVPLQDRTDRALKSYLRVRGAWWCTKGANLFVSRRGNPMDRGAFGKTFRRYRALAGLSGFSMYGLKHYAATTLAQTDIWAASEITGVSIETLKARYLHKDPAHIRARLEEADPVGKALKGR